MTRKRQQQARPSLRTVTAERAARLYRLLKILGTGPQTREGLKKRLRLDTRGFYRDLETLREAGVTVPLRRQRYSLEIALADAIACLPLPDPRLTLGEAMVLAKGRTPAHQKLKKQLKAIIA